MQTNKINVEELIHELTLTFNSCEAQEVYQLIVDKKRKAAFKILKEYYSAEEADAIIDYYYAKHDRKMSFQEVQLKDIEKLRKLKIIYLKWVAA